MAATNQRSPRFTSWAMIYHQGFPVAVCPVEAVSGDTMQLVCGPLRFERHAPLVLQVTHHREPGRIGTRMKGTVEGIDANGMQVRLEPTRG
ncbi:hypothetical protein [Thiohalorhabdus sp.]|uniref:hypothetical protein n=1 Tax=Thiohalorhabdus sp. TaxID=3094134 RepID=UPI002FC2C955